jgi:hypothetical protein
MLLTPVPEHLPVQIIAERMQLAREQLAEARSLGEAKQIADGAAVIVEWLKRQSDLGLEIVNDGSLLRLQAEARMGGYLMEPGVVAGDGRPLKPCQPDTVSAPTHRALGIDRKAAQRCRELWIVRELLPELEGQATAAGRELTREAVLRVARKLKPPLPSQNGNGLSQTARSPVELPDGFLNAIVIGDARELARQLPNASIALCIADPMYDRIDDYRWLAKECERVLVAGGSLVAQCGNLRRFDCEQAMRESSLTPVDVIAEVYPYALGRLWRQKIFVGWKPHLWFSNGDRRGDWLLNRVFDKGGKPQAENSKEFHPWGDAHFVARALMEKLCSPGDLIWDPFTGSGSVPAVAAGLGFSFVAFEIDEGIAAGARQRLAGARRWSGQQTIMPLQRDAI